MPTGYTDAVGRGIVTDFNEYAMRCARNFGALVMMRDEPMDAPIPDEFQPSQWNAEYIATSQAKLEQITSATDSECQQLATDEFNMALSRWQERKTENMKQKKLYEAMLTKARAYVPPTDGHKGFAKFIVSQLVDSIDSDCLREYDKKPTLQDVSTWKAAKIQTLLEDIERYSKNQREEYERAAERNKWVADLRQSLQASNHQLVNQP